MTTPVVGAVSNSTSGNVTTKQPPVSMQEIAELYESRINNLVQWADEDGIRVNDESIRQFLNLVGETLELGEASLTMTDAGDINARWGSLDGNHLAIELLMEQRAEYTLVTTMKNCRTQWDAGICTIADVSKILARAKEAGIRSVWQHDGYPTATP